MSWNNKKYSFISKPTLTITFHRSAQFMLSQLRKAWTEYNFQEFFFFFEKNKKYQFTNTSTSICFLMWDSGPKKRRKCSLWRKEQEAGRMGTAEQVPPLAETLCLPDGGRKELITFLWEELHSQIFVRCFKSFALCNCPAFFYSLLFCTEAPFTGQIECLKIGRKRSHRGQVWQTFLRA